MDFITAAQFPELFDKNVREVVEGVEKELHEEFNTRAMLFTEGSTDRQYEKYSSVTSSPDIGEWDGALDYLPQYPGYDFTVQPKIYAGATQYERELFDTKQQSVLDDRAKNLARSVYRKLDKIAIEPLSLGFAATNGSMMTSEEGVALFGAHLNKTGYSTASGFTNYGTGALTPANLQTAIINMSYFRTDIGERTYARPDTLIIPTNLRFRAEEIVGTDKGLYSAEGTKNVLGPSGSGKLKIMEIPRLGDYDTNNWFLVNEREMKQALLWLWVVKPDYASTVDFETKAFKTSAYTELGWLFRAWRFGWGSLVS